MMTLPVNAALCHQTDHHTICILKIKRSAKNYWEYRAAVTIDQEVRPMEIYNCREQHRITKEGNMIPFESDGAGTYICRVLKR
ncbi:hypothetical protein VB715_20260 [Crocosphaera sp. UHCC 0190]|uniref:hypothetical protein n=1 Tax=Crocosphaera sp. UHCC 0190 TaxID=3110246 RepID=UPI002B1EB3EF|nr:hypothetical protein [Crocosphaera sp. UHCC 0190]MEA5512112.1 hypothetical protein [Crocosphaera sp. UHCC 0190]